MYDSRGIANIILDYCSDKNIELTNLKIQKIIFFCHAWFLVIAEKPLVKQTFEAWEYGPVLAHVYRQFNSFRGQPITGRISKLDIKTNKLVTVETNLEESDKALLSQIVDIYTRYSSNELVEMSHIKNGPWWNAWHHTAKVNPGMRIENIEIKNFYASFRPYFVQ